MLIYIIEFLLLFLVAYLCYYFVSFVSSKNKENSNNMLSEVKLFVKLYNINLKKVSYKKLSKTIYLILSFDLALTVFFAVNIPLNIFLKVLIGIIILVSSIFISYRLLGIYYTKKGMTKNV